MQIDPNNILIKKGFLEVTRLHENGLNSQNPIEVNKKVTFHLRDSGVLWVEPDQPSESSIVISSGVHGNETAPIEIVDDLVKQIIDGQLNVKNRTLFIIGNPVAMNLETRFDIENMNRLFNGKHRGKDHHEALRAAHLESLVEQFYLAQPETRRLHYDLHTAIRGSKFPKFAIYPYPDGRPWDKGQLAFFLSCEINTLLLGHQPAGTFSYFSSHRFNAHAFTVELGKVKPFGENDAQEFSAIHANLKKLISGQEIKTRPFDNTDFNLFQVKAEIIKKSSQFALHVADNLENFTSFEAGFQLTHDIDGGYCIKETGESIVFPNINVPIGQRAGLVVTRTEL